MSRSENPDEVKEIVVKIFEVTRRHHPDREADLPALLRNYRGREGEVISWPPGLPAAPRLP